MTRPLVHLREQVRSERCSWGVINMENGREDRLRLGKRMSRGADLVAERGVHPAGRRQSAGSGRGSRRSTV